MIGITVLGSTGSVGVSALDVIKRHPDRYRVVALSANQDLEGIYRQSVEFSPDYVVLKNESQALKLKKKLETSHPNVTVLSKMEGLQEIVRLPQVHSVVAAIVGVAGLLPAFAAVQAGKRLLLANKEALVVAGELFVDQAKRSGAEILPVDSEHNAVFQCLPGSFDGDAEKVGVQRILLTASGGPFRSVPISQLDHVSPEQACAHPNWTMGQKISVDSATMMNKGLEVIEACQLFGMNSDQVQVVVHPQSVIHSLVEYIDGSVLAQLGNPDMRTPIAHALAWPDRIESGVTSLDLFEVAKLDFEKPDLKRFPCLELSYQANQMGGSARVALNAANEVAVDAFLKGELAFTAIAKVVDRTLHAIQQQPVHELEEILAFDQEARLFAQQAAGKMAI